MASPSAEIPPSQFHLCEPVALKLPLADYVAIFRGRKFVYLLESALPTGRLSNFSFLGGDPELVFRAKRRVGTSSANIDVLRFSYHDDTPVQSERQVTVGDPFAALQTLMDEFAIDPGRYTSRPAPLLAGAVGYLGYEAGHLLEEIPDSGEDELDLPDAYFMFCDQGLVYCHRTNTSYLSVVGRDSSDAGAQANAIRRRDQLLQRIAHIEASPPSSWRGPLPSRSFAHEPIEVEGDFDEESYCRAVRTIQDHIAAGNIYQACMTHRLRSPLYGGNAWDVYQELRRINPAPFAAYLRFPEAEVVSSSPERFLAIDAERLAESRPIKGTRPRHSTPEADLALRDELATSIKDQAENIMIVDLVRNDFGRACKFHSVDVPELMVIEPYATVFQMVSTIRGQLRDDVRPLDLVRACFPGGSMTGAPKIEAMKIIDQLEPACRGIYSGCLGYLDFAGPLDLSIVIRSFIIKDDWCYYHVGGAVVADSDPRAEYLETLAKARALKAALANLRQMSATASEKSCAAPA